MHPDFVVIGESDKKAGDLVEEMYKQLLMEKVTDKMGNPKPDTQKRDYERVPLLGDVDEGRLLLDPKVQDKDIYNMDTYRKMDDFNNEMKMKIDKALSTIKNKMNAGISMTGF